MRARVGTACASERAEYERKVAARERRTGSRKGRHKPPTEAPEAKEQINLTDADSALMRKSRRHEYRQAYNAQAAVDADGSQLVLGARVSVCASDRNDGGCGCDPGGVGRGGSGTGGQRLRDGQRGQLAGRGVEVLVATGAEGQRRQHDFRPEPPHQLAKEPQADWVKSMQRTAGAPGALPFAQAVEPVFGIVKQAMGFRQFLLRGLEKVEGEWALVTLAYNCRRLHNLRLA